MDSEIWKVRSERRSLVINPIIEQVLHSVSNNVSWLQNIDDIQPDQFIVWAEDDTRPSLIGDDHPLVMSYWLQVSLYTRCGLSGGIDPTVKTTEIIDALLCAKFKITEYPSTTIDASGYYHTVIRVRYDVYTGGRNYVSV